MNKKKTLIIIIQFAAAIVICLFVWQICRHRKEISAIEILPPIILDGLYGDTLDTRDLASTGRKSVIVCFSPDCDFCGMESDEIIKYHKSLSEYNLLFITPAQTDEIFSFLAEHPLDAIPGIKILIDSECEFFKTFAVTSPPVCFIYDEQMRLIARYKGVISVDNILDFMNNGQENYK